ncbi:MAG: hypothetical protein LRY53_00680 [Burkholderiaceae bacterium]|nr:hypothetical protein [Burkholderiaceae bacterium]
MKRSTLRLIVSLTVVFFLAWVFWFSTSNPRILVLQSVSQPSDWATRVDQGIRAALRNNRLPVTVVTHYMGLDGAGSDTEIRVAVAAAREAIANNKPDILIAVDDESNTLVASQLPVEQRPAIVYTAILQAPKAYDYSAATRATGVRESVASDAIIELLNAVKGDEPLRIAAIGVDDVTGRAELERLKAGQWSKHTLGPTKLVNNFVQWQAFVKEAASQADVLVVLSTDMLQGEGPDQFLPEQTVIEWTEANSRPLPIGIRDSFVRYGGALAVASPPSVYGRLAMQMSLDWIANGLSASPPEPKTVKEFNVAVSASKLKQRGIELPAVYSELARATSGLYP